MLNIVTPTEFTQLLRTEHQPILAGCLQQDHAFSEQIQLLRKVAKKFHTTHTVCLLNPAYMPEFRRSYAIAGTPSYLLFHMGEEKTRFLGYADALNLMNILIVDDVNEYEDIAPSHGYLPDELDPVSSIGNLLRRK